MWKVMSRRRPEGVEGAAADDWGGERGMESKGMEDGGGRRAPMRTRLSIPSRDQVSWRCPCDRSAKIVPIFCKTGNHDFRGSPIEMRQNIQQKMRCLVYKRPALGYFVLSLTISEPAQAWFNMGSVSSNLFCSYFRAFVWKHYLHHYEALWKLVQHKPEWTEHCRFYPLMGLLFLTGVVVTSIVATVTAPLRLWF